MKNNIFKGLLACGVAVAMAGCSENSWNEKYLDGFEAPNPNAPQRNYIDYTLTSSDYKKIACMKANVQKAKAAGVEEQLAEMGSKGCFNEVITVREYIPAWLDSIANTPTSVFKSAVANTTARITYENAVVDETQVPFTPSNAVASITSGAAVDVNVAVTGICAQGMIVTDNSGSVLAYTGKSFDASAWSINDQLNITGSGATYGGAMQIGSPVYNLIGGISTIKPTPKVISTAAEWDAVAKVYDDANSAKTGAFPQYIKATVKVKLDGNYVNFLVDGANYGGSLYQGLDTQKAAFANKDDATVTVEGWAVSRTYSPSMGKTLCNIIPVYVDGTAVVPVAQKAVVIESTMSQFVRTTAKNWVFDPTVYVTMQTGSSGNFTDEISGKFWYGCVEWVWQEKCVKELGLNPDLWNNWGEANVFTTHGYVWGRGKATQEGYSGASAWYGNYDSRVSTLKQNFTEEQMDTYFPGLNDEQITETLQKHFATEVAPGALGMCYPDAKPGTGGIDQEYEVTLLQYNPSRHNVTLRYRVVAPGKFVFVECADWNLSAE